MSSFYETGRVTDDQDLDFLIAEIGALQIYLQAMGPSFYLAQKEVSSILRSFESMKGFRNGIG